MKQCISIGILTFFASIICFSVKAENLFDVIEDAQKTINQKYPDKSSIARSIATEELEKIARSDKSEEEKIAEIRGKYPATSVQTTNNESEKKTEMPNLGVDLEEKPLNDEETFSLPGGVKLKMIKVEAGSFEMSAKDKDNRDIIPSEVPHQATLTKDFYIGRTEVTQAQWHAVKGTNPSSFEGDDLPVNNVSWNDAMVFCGMLNVTGKAPNGWKFTLPTETQWEFAARGGNNSNGYIYGGSNDLDEVAWHSGNSQRKTHPVGQKKANELGLYDMSGNVEEWCLDDTNGDSSKQKAEFTRENDSGGSDRVFRGGNQGGSGRYCRLSCRGSAAPSTRGDNLGFRIALVQIQQ